ncbi:MAG: hypothetical protein ONB32_06835 [candidate division KSB1 bacterium]|nr:hypothetical protein [candidate division KSB1 bacterium]
MRQIASLLIIGLVLVRCGDLERNNPFDPKNPNATIAQTIAVELFVNDSTGFEFCSYATGAIEELAQETIYRDKICVLEYHLMNRVSGWNDIYAMEEFNQRYYEYVPNSSERAIPDAMFNGLTKRVQGASFENIKQRYVDALGTLLGRTSPFGLQGIKKISNNGFELDLRLAMYGNGAKENLRLIAVIYEDLNMKGHRFLVRQILPVQTIPHIQHGEIKSFRFSAPLPRYENATSLYAVVLVQDSQSSKKEILQAASF